MTEPPAPTRGRPRSITPDAIAEAGMAIGLQDLTFVGVARSMGISHMALYKHVPNVEALRALVAEQIFHRWPLPAPDPDAPIVDYLRALAAAVWQLTRDHPGLARYLLDPEAITVAMASKIGAHQEEIATLYDLEPDNARWLLFTVSYHCVALAATILRETDTALAPQPALVPPCGALEVAGGFAIGIQALIDGALAISGNDR